MTRMFKQLVASSRKKLSRAPANVRQESTPKPPQVIAEPRKKPDFEPLESRVLFSGIGTGFNKRRVTFIDAWGDAVLVKLIGGPTSGRFDITLDGGAKNHADIQNITINGMANAATVLDVFVHPKHLTLSDNYTGGKVTAGDPVTTVYAKTISNRIFTPGFVQIGSIIATTNLRGITMNGADFQDIDVTGNIGTGKRIINGVSHPLHGGIAVDIGDAQFRSGLLDDPFSKIDFGNIEVSGSVDSLILQGRSSTPSSNNLVGSITVGMNLASIDAQFSDVLAPITVGSMGGAFFHNIAANITSSGAIGQIVANNITSGITATGAVAGVSLAGALSGRLEAASFGSISVNGNFSGALQADTGGIGNIVINSGSAFTGTILAEAGNIGNIVLSQANTPFSAQVTAGAGSIGAITAGYFSNAAVSAALGIGAITSNATMATVAGGIVNSVFRTTGGAIGNISSIASITNSQFQSVGGAIGSVTVLQGGINGAVIGGSTSTLATSIGNITANLSIENTSVIASGAIGNITSIAGHIGGSSNVVSYSASSNPKSDVFIGGSIGNIYALGDISGNVVTATAGAIGAITSHEGRLAFDSVNATGSIGNVYANSQNATFSFDSAGNTLSAQNSYYNFVPSASAIDHSTFTAGGAIGGITARASAVAAYSGTGSNATYIPNRAIDSSFFTAGTGIGNVYALAASAGHHDPFVYKTTSVTTVDTDTRNIKDGITTYQADNGTTYTYTTTTYHGVTTTTVNTTTKTPTHLVGGDAAIFDSNFLLAGTGAGGIGNILAVANGGPAIYGSTIRAATGNIGNVTGRSILGTGIYKSTIESDIGNIGIVKGLALGGSGPGGGNGLEQVTISAGAAPYGTGSIGGIYGKSAHGSGIDHVIASAGAPAAGSAIGYITGISTATVGGNGYTASGISFSKFTAAGVVGAIKGTASAASGILDVKVAAASIGDITGSTSGYGSGISHSGFYALSGIGNITGAATSHRGANGISYSFFNANTLDNGTGAILNITGTTAGSVGYDGSTRADGIFDSEFFAGAGIKNIIGSATNVYGGSGIAASIFDADSSLTGVGGIASILGKTVGNSGYGIFESIFNAGTGIGTIYGEALGSYSSSGILGSNFNADDAHLYKLTNTIGNIKGISGNLFGSASGITGSTFTAGYGIGNIIGTSSAPGNGSYGIGNSRFYAGSGYSSATSAPGRIGNVLGQANANGAYGLHAGIYGSSFIAGAGPNSNGVIGTVTGNARLNGSKALQAYGLLNDTIVAGSSSGSVNTVTGYALAQGAQSAAIGQKSLYVVSAAGIANTIVYAGTGSTSIGSGVIDGIVGKGIAEAAFGSAYASGILHSGFAAGGSAMGRINSIAGTATASAHYIASAYGIYESAFQAATLTGGIGYVGSVTATAIATSQGAAYAAGIAVSGIWSGDAQGTITSVTASATATGQTIAYSVGIRSVANEYSFAYGNGFPGGYTLKAGSGALGTGTIGPIVATATSVAGTGLATAYGFNNAKIFSGLGAGGTGAIASISGTAAATSASGSALAYGIANSLISSGLNSGTILGGVSGTATAIVTSTNLSNSYATAFGIYNSGILAGYSGTYGKIGAVTGTATAKIHSSFESLSATGTAYAAGIANSGIYSQATPYGGIAPGPGIGIIGNVTGTGNAYAYGYQVTAGGLGISKYTSIVASNGPQGNGTIAGVYGHGKAIATATVGEADAYSDGIFSIAGYGFKSNTYVTVSAGTGLNSVGHIGNVSGSAVSVASTPGSAEAYASAHGTNDLLIYSGSAQFLSKGYVGSVSGTGTATATGGVAESSAHGITATTIDAGTLLGSVGAISGAATAYSYAHGAASPAISRAYGIYGLVANVATTLSNAKAAYAGSGSIASISGVGHAKAYTYGVNTTGGSYATGIYKLAVNIGDATSTKAGAVAGATGTVGSITGTATSYAKAGAAGSSGYATATGINTLTVDIADAIGITYAKAGTGSMGVITATATAAVKAAGMKAYTYAYGLDGVTLSVGNATASTGLVSDLAFGGIGTIGAISETMTSTANVGTLAKAVAIPGGDLGLYAGNAYGGSAYGGKGYIAKAATISGMATATASAYHGSALAVGLYNIKASAANADGQYYATAKNAIGDIGQFTATAVATATALNLPGSVNTSAKAYALELTKAYAANAAVESDNAIDSVYGGSGVIGGFTGTATATAKSISPFNATSFAKAQGIYQIYGYAGNAVNFGQGPAKVAYGKIGTQGIITGVGTASASSKGGNDASAMAIGYGIHGIGLGAADAITYGGGAALAGNAIAYVNTVKGTGSGTAYAYSHADPYTKAGGYGVASFAGDAFIRAGNAVVNADGTAPATAAGGIGGGGSATAYGLFGYGTATANSVGSGANITNLTALAYSSGLHNVAVQVAFAGTDGNAYGGAGSFGTHYGINAGIVGKASSTASVSATISKQSVGKATAESAGIASMYADIGVGYSYGQNAAAYAASGQIGNVFASAVSGATSNAVSSKVIGSAYGIDSLNLIAGTATGYNAEAGTGTIGYITASGIATGYASSGVNTTYTAAVVHGFGIKYLSALAASAFATDSGDARGATGTIGNVTGTGSANAMAIADMGKAYAYSAGISGSKLNPVSIYAGYAYGFEAVAGAGTVGSITGGGAATASGDHVLTVSAGIDPVVVYAGVAQGREYGAGGSQSSIGSITGSAKSIATGNLGYTNSYGIRALTARAGDAFSAYDDSESFAGSARIGNISGTAVGTAEISLFTGPIQIAAGISGSTFSAGTAVGGEAFVKVGVVGAVYGYGGLSVSGYQASGLALAGGLGNVNLYAGFAQGSGFAESITAGGSSIGAITGKAVLTDAIVPEAISYGIAGAVVHAGDARASIPYRGAYAGSGSVGNILGTASTNLTGLIDGGASSTVNGITNSFFGAGYAIAYNAHAAAGTFGYITGSATNYVNVYSFMGGVVASNSHGIYNMKIRAGAALGVGSNSRAVGSTGTTGSISGTVGVTLIAHVHGSSSKLSANNIDGISDSSVLAGTAYAASFAYAGPGYIASALGQSITGTASISLSGGGATAGNTVANAAGVYHLAIGAGNAAASYRVVGASGNVGPVTGTGTATANIYYAVTKAYGLQSLAIRAGNATGATGSYTNQNIYAHAGAGTIGAITGTGTARSYGQTYEFAASSTAYGITGSTARAGYAAGTSAVGGTGSSVGKITGTSVALTDAYLANAQAFGVSGSYFVAGSATGTGKVIAGSGSIGSGTGIYGSATATANNVIFDSLADKGHASATAEGLGQTYVGAGVARATGGTKGNLAYGNTGTIGAINGKGYATALSNIGVYQNATAYGIVNYTAFGIPSPLADAGSAFGAAKAIAGQGTVGAVYGLANAFANGGIPTSASAFASGIGGGSSKGLFGFDEDALYIGYAGASPTSGVAHGGDLSSVASVKGLAHAYAFANSAVGSASSYAVGIHETYISVGQAFAFNATAGAGSMGAIAGTGFATASGFSATSTALGIDPSYFVVSGAAQYNPFDNFIAPAVKPNIPLIMPTAASSTASSGSIASITGTATAVAAGHGDGASAVSFGLDYVTAKTGEPAGSGNVPGVGAINGVTGTAMSYGYGTGSGAYSAKAFGIYKSVFIAGAGGLPNGSHIGPVTGKGTASNGAYNSTLVTGAHTTAAGIYGSTFYSGGSIGYISGKAFQAGGTTSGGIKNDRFYAGTSIGNVYGSNTGTSFGADGIGSSYFVAGTTIGNVTGKASGTHGDGIFGSDFRALNSGKTGPNVAIGNITATSNAAYSNLANAAVFDSTFTTAGSIGTISLTGSLLGSGASGFFAGDLLGGTLHAPTVSGTVMTTSASIGHVNISGYSIGADIVASVTAASGKNYFGNSGDTGTTGSINGLNVGTGSIVSVELFSPGENENSGVEAGSLGTALWNIVDANFAGSLGTTGVYAEFTNASSVATRIRQL